MLLSTCLHVGSYHFSPESLKKNMANTFKTLFVTNAHFNCSPGETFLGHVGLRLEWAGWGGWGWCHSLYMHTSRACQVQVHLRKYVAIRDGFLALKDGIQYIVFLNSTTPFFTHVQQICNLALVKTTFLQRENAPERQQKHWPTGRQPSSS